MLFYWSDSRVRPAYKKKLHFDRLVLSSFFLTALFPSCSSRCDVHGQQESLRPCGGKHLLTLSATATIDNPLPKAATSRMNFISPLSPEVESLPVFHGSSENASSRSAGPEVAREAATHQVDDQASIFSTGNLNEPNPSTPIPTSSSAAATAAAAAALGTEAHDAGAAQTDPNGQGEQIEFKVIYGEDAPRGRFPYICTLRDPDFGTVYCAGTLIHPEVVLTAGHCLSKDRLPFDPDLNPIIVVCGDYVPSADNGTDIIRSRGLAVNPDWKAREADIGLLWLARPARNTPTVAVASPEDWDMIYVEGQELWGVGFGRLNMEESGEGRRFPQVLQEFQAPILSTKTCNELYEGEVNARTMMCVGDDDGGPATCKGDSGGPMVYVPENIDDPSSHIQVAIISWSGDSCGTALEPDVNTKVSAFYNWIQQGISEVESESKAGGPRSP